MDTLLSKPALLRIRGRSWWFKEGKNWAMSNAKVLIVRFLTHPEWMIWVRIILASVVNLCLRPPNWLRWIKLLEIVWNWRWSPIIFSKSFPIVFNQSIWFGWIVHSLVRFGNYDHCWQFEMRWPVSQIYTSISDVY